MGQRMRVTPLQKERGNESKGRSPDGTELLPDVDGPCCNDIWVLVFRPELSVKWVFRFVEYRDSV